MPNFKVGDIVRGINASRYGCTNSDMTKGKVTHVYSDGNFNCIILEHKHPEKASCEIGCEHTDLDPKYFELVPKFAVGQIYRVGKCGHTLSGGIIKIEDIKSDRVWGIKYKVIRGKKTFDGDGFDEGSVFANSLALLTGKQIGEAIKAFDEKKETGVKEVRRAAKPGEYIKIIDAVGLSGDEYKNGDILLVVKADAVFSSSLTHGEAFYKNEMWKYASRDEYVVLEGYKPKQAKPANAKIGDTVRLIADCGGVAICGKSGKVVNIAEDGVYAKLPPHTASYHLPYFIPNDKYEIIHSGKHSYTAEQIERAKNIVLDTIREYAEKDEQITMHRVEDSIAEFEAVIIHHDTELSNWDCSYPGKNQKRYAFTGEYANSKCSSTDEPNEWIGKCVALCKVLHKPIPSFIMGN